MSVIRHPNTAGATLTQWRYTATGGETSLSGTDGFSTALSYTVGSEQVFINGVLLERGVDYAATTGTTITGLTALVANDIATVISPSSFNVANAIPLSTVTAKGDLLAATGASTVTNLPVGADGTTLVADSSTSTGLRYQATQTAGKNKIINGDMAIAQRSTSVSGISTSDTYYAIDRYKTAISGTGLNITISRDTNVPNATFSYSQKVQQLSTNATLVSQFAVAQSIETSQVSALYGKTATVSFWYKSNLTGNHYLRIYTGSQTGGADSATAFNITTANTWQYVTVTTSNFANVTAITNYSLGAQLDIGYRVYQGGSSVTITANDYFQFTGFQLELGSVATVFQTATGTLQGELTACQRYFQMSYQQGVTPGTNTASGADRFRAEANTGQFVIDTARRFPMPLRVSPTFTWYSTAGNSGNITASGSNVVVSATYDYSSTVSPYAYTATSIAAGADVQWHWTANAEL